MTSTDCSNQARLHPPSPTEALITFPEPLLRARLIKRYKRFFADVVLDDGTTVTAHCPNTGTMKTCGEPGSIVYVLPNHDPKRKLRYTWEYTEVSGGFIGINTQRPNRLVEAAISQHLVPELSGHARLRREVAYGEASKIDLHLVSSEGEQTYVEIKNATMLAADQVVFPDAVTARGRKHLEELTRLKQEKPETRCVMFMLVNRPDGKSFNVASAIDPAYAKALKQAMASGVELLCYRADSHLTGMQLGSAVPIKLN